MKGALFRVVQDVVEQEFSEDDWDAILERAGSDGAYTTLGDYPSSELMKLAGAACQHFDMEADQLVHFIGTKAFPFLRAYHPQWVDAHDTSRTFLRGLQTVIHDEVRKAYNNPNTPRFEVKEDGDTMTIVYDSKRQLCRLAHGLLEGCLAHFGDQGTVEQTHCGREQGRPCTFQVRYGA